jgi:hypothetical protein
MPCIYAPYKCPGHRQHTGRCSETLLTKSFVPPVLAAGVFGSLMDSTAKMAEAYKNKLNPVVGVCCTSACVPQWPAHICLISF